MPGQNCNMLNARHLPILLLLLIGLEPMRLLTTTGSRHLHHKHRHTRLALPNDEESSSNHLWSNLKSNDKLNKQLPIDNADNLSDVNENQNDDDRERDRFRSEELRNLEHIISSSQNGPTASGQPNHQPADPISWPALLPFNPRLPPPALNINWPQEFKLPMPTAATIGTSVAAAPAHQGEFFALSLSLFFLHK